MESSGIGEGIKDKQESLKNESKVSVEVWRDLLHTEIVAIGIFPQSTFAPGVLLANRMANLVNEQKIPLYSLLEQNPSQQLIDTMLQEAKSKSHDAYGFTTKATIPGIQRIWERDKRHARGVLVGLSKVIYKTNVDVSYPNKGRKVEDILLMLRRALLNSQSEDVMLDKVFSNREDFSLLLEFLGVARESLLSPEVRERSKSYKEKISMFMQKYSMHNFLDIPDGYDNERTDLMDTLIGLLADAAGFMKQELIVHTERQHPENRILLNHLRKSSVDQLFAGVAVSSVNPLRNPNRQHTMLE